MLVRNIVIITFLAVLGTACSTFARGDGSTQNAAGYPVLSQQRMDRPQPGSNAEVMAVYNSLIDQRTELTNAVSTDRSEVASLRPQTVNLFINGRQEAVDISQAMARMEAARIADIAAAQQQTAAPLPELGGQPPKDQR